MIKERNLEKGYIRGKSQEIKADPLLVERAIFAFELLSQLVKVRIPLIFKGGTSLMILMPELKRISIDIDIVTEAKDTMLVNAFNILISKSLFKRWEEDKRTSKKRVSKRHFKFYYDSPVEGSELYILLDIFPIITYESHMNPLPKANNLYNLILLGINCLFMVFYRSYQKSKLNETGRTL